MGLPVTPFCNRHTVNMPRAQIGFISAFVKPTLQSLATVCPEFGDMALLHLMETVEEWAAEESDGVRAPRTEASIAPTFRPLSKTGSAINVAPDRPHQATVVES